VLNGRDLRMPEDEAYDLVVRIAAGEEDDVADVAATLRRWVDAV
jgi:prophage maintenance system killer protein